MKHYIYIPGFGTWQDLLRRLALQRWRSKSSKVSFVPMRWLDRADTYEHKYARVIRAIELADGDEIILVGESAGGAMALGAFARDIERVDRVVTVCGYNHGSQDIGASYRRRSPAFYTAVQESEQSLTTFSPTVRNRITTIYSITDRTVTPSHSRIDGSLAVELSSGGHLLNIARVLRGGRKGLDDE